VKGDTPCSDLPGWHSRHWHFQRMVPLVIAGQALWRTLPGLPILCLLRNSRRPARGSLAY
jgi:hypothetical protein